MLENYASNLSTSIDTSLQPSTNLTSISEYEGNYYNHLNTNRSSFICASYDLPISLDSSIIAQSTNFNPDISIGSSVIPSQSIYDYYNSNFSQSSILLKNEVDLIAQPSPIKDDQGISSDKSLIPRQNIFDYYNYNLNQNDSSFSNQGVSLVGPSPIKDDGGISSNKSLIARPNIFDYYNYNFSNDSPSTASNELPPSTDSLSVLSNAQTDIVWRNSSTGANLVWQMNGTNLSSSVGLASVGDSNWKIGATGDFNSDGQTDIVWRNSATGGNLIWLMNGNTLSSTVGLASVGDTNWRIEAAADFNSDAKTDIVWRNYSTGANLVWLMNGTSLSSSVGLASVGDTNWRIEAAADFNSDAKTDIVWRNSSTGANLVWLMNGTSLSSTVGLASVGDTNWRIEAAADFNSDAKTDIVWRNYSTGANLIWLMNGTSLGSTVGLASVGDSNWQIAGVTQRQVLTNVVAGTLRANTFTLQSGYTRTVFSGNGNVDFATTKDILNLSNISSSTVNFSWSDQPNGGVLFNPGNGTRLFDAITLSDGRQILFEDIDQISFANGIINLSVVPNDPQFNQQWNLHMMGVQNAWRFTKGSSNVLIGVQDTGLGVDNNGYIHSDLRTTTVYLDNYADDYFRNVPGEGYGARTTSHGTDVQGIIAAATNNSFGMSGINWNSNVFSIDVIDNNQGDQTLAQATQNMINQASQNGQRMVINLSLSGGGDSVFEQLIANNQSNALFVIASGNGNASSLSYPSSLANTYNNVIAVGASWGATDTYGNLKTPGTRISYPGWWGSNYGTGLTLMGPSEVIATAAQKQSSGVVFGYDLEFNGTSAATPNVAGVASLVWSANSNLTATQIKQILSQTAYDLGTSGYDTQYGNGFVNADAAVRRALALGKGAA